jgi:hypothetical protein
MTAGVPEQTDEGRVLPAWASHLWKSNITPMAVIRTIGPWGPNLVKLYTDRRFHFLPQAENDALREYLYHICAQKGSGEYALSSLLAPGAWAKKPIGKRLKDVKCDVSFICILHMFITAYLMVQMATGTGWITRQRWKRVPQCPSKQASVSSQMPATTCMSVSILALNNLYLK